MNVLLLAILATILSACTDTDTARRVLDEEGYTNVKITGYDLLMCGKDDDFSTGFTATKNGKVVSGAVCSAIFKGATIRRK